MEGLSKGFIEGARERIKIHRENARGHKDMYAKLLAVSLETDVSLEEGITACNGMDRLVENYRIEMEHVEMIRGILGDDKRVTRIDVTPPVFTEAKAEFLESLVMKIPLKP